MDMSEQWLFFVAWLCVEIVLSIGNHAFEQAEEHAEFVFREALQMKVQRVGDERQDARSDSVTLIGEHDLDDAPVVASTLALKKSLGLQSVQGPSDGPGVDVERACQFCWRVYAFVVNEQQRAPLIGRQAQGASLMVHDTMQQHVQVFQEKADVVIGPEIPGITAVEAGLRCVFRRDERCLHTRIVYLSI